MPSLLVKFELKVVWSAETHVVSSHRVPYCHRFGVGGAIAAVRGQMCYTYEYVVKWMQWRGERGERGDDGE